jgi:hypothetical protein
MRTAASDIIKLATTAAAGKTMSKGTKKKTPIATRPQRNLGAKMTFHIRVSLYRGSASDATHLK